MAAERLQKAGFVENRVMGGAGHATWAVRLTTRGRVEQRNPPQRHLFISHAAIDQHIAARLRKELEICFPTLNIFVSSAPDKLRPGDQWAEVILDALGKAEAAILLLTSRGVTRPWVWYEGGAAWSKGLPWFAVCLGAQKKGALPPPFSLSQAISLEDRPDVVALIAELEQTYGKSASEPDADALVADCMRLEADAAQAESLQQDPAGAETKRFVHQEIAKMNAVNLEALRMLVLHGEATDQVVMAHVRQKGLMGVPYAALVAGMANSSVLVQFVEGSNPPGVQDGGRYRINPRCLPYVREALFPKHDATE